MGWLQKRKLRLKYIRWLLFGIYCLFIVWYTILNRRPTNNHRVQWELLWSYREWFTGDPNWKKDVVQNLNNILFFIPFGFFFLVKKWWAVLISALCVSVIVEAIQYFGGYGLAELDDMVCNTLGAMIGYWSLCCLEKMISRSDT